MKLGLDSYSYHLAFGAHPDFAPKQKMTLFQFIERVAELCLDGFQIDPMHLKNRDRIYLSELLASAKEKKLFLEYGAMGVESEYLKTELEICSMLESPVLRTFVGFDRFDKNTNIETEIRNAIENLNKIKSDAESAGIKIAIENHGDVTTDELVRIIQEVESPNIGICLDLGNAMMTLEEPLSAAEKMAPYAFTTHFKDYAIQLTNYGFKVTGVALGDGNIDLQRALSILNQKANLDKIILELPVEAGSDEAEAIRNEDDIVRRSVRYARDILGIQ